jgi:anti-sigma factor RsiW
MTMSCRSVSDVLAEYLAGELAPDQRGAVESHLDVCATCREHVAGLGAAQAAVRQMVVPREHAEALAARLAMPAAVAASARRKAWGWRAAVAAGLALAFVAGYATRGVTGPAAPVVNATGPVAAAPRQPDERPLPRLVEEYRRTAAQHPGESALAWGLLSVAKR